MKYMLNCIYIQLCLLSNMKDFFFLSPNVRERERERGGGGYKNKTVFYKVAEKS